MVLKNIFRGDIIQCHGYNNGEIISYKLPSGSESHRYGRYDQVVGRNVVLCVVEKDKYMLVGNAFGVIYLSTKATGEDSYYVDKDTLVEYEYPCIPEDNCDMYGDSEMNDGSVKLSKK